LIFLLSCFFRFFATFFLHFRRSRSSGHLRKKKHEKTIGLIKKRKKNSQKKKRNKVRKKAEKKATAYKCIIRFVFFLLCFCFFKIVVWFFLLLVP
jgi:Flp pilus assembly protein TadB